ncbi:elongation factor 1-beta-like [Aristolochia californica]|uniref:elongation factor 1-beta-like n=1 Tax=Aristolochia californica TaxID=171875 RepID=UPI0035D5E9C2
MALLSNPRMQQQQKLEIESDCKVFKHTRVALSFLRFVQSKIVITIILTVAITNLGLQWCNLDAAPAVDDDDDDLDLFGEETEEDKKAAEERREEKKAAEERTAAKATAKKKESGKSSVVLDVKPWDDETDMKKQEEAVRGVEMPGLLWGASKLVPVGYSIKKLQIMMTIVDDLVSVDGLIEEHLTEEKL